MHSPVIDRVGLSTSVSNTAGMVYHLFQAAGNQSEAAYYHQMTGAGLLYWERHQFRLQCLECGE